MLSMGFNRARFSSSQSTRRLREGPCGCAGVCVENVTVSGAEAVQPARMDTYMKMPNVTHAGRPVYQLVGSTIAYLFYHPSTGGWSISSDYLLSGSSTLKSTSNAGAACPDQATGWQAYKDGAWVSTYPISIVPTSPTTSAPTTVGKRSGYFRKRSAYGCSRSPASRARTHCRFQCRMISRAAAAASQCRRPSAAVDRLR